MKSAIRSWALIGLIAGILALAGSASAQIQTFAKIGDIKGSSTDVHHKDWIDVLSLRQPYAIDASNLQRTTGGRTTAKEPCTVEIVKGLDIAGPKLWGQMMKGTHIPEVTIEVTTLGERQRLLYEIVMKEALITSIVTTGGPRAVVGDIVSGGMVFAETVTVEAAQVELAYYQENPDGTSGGKVAASFNCSVI